MSPRKGTAVQQQALDFFNPYRHGFARVAVAVPRVRVADPGFNAGETIAMFKQAAGRASSLDRAAPRCSRRWFQGKAAAQVALMN